MAHQDYSEAAPVDDMDSAAAAISGLDLNNFADDEDGEDAPDEVQEDHDGEEGDDIDLDDDDDADDEGEEQDDEPAIDAPVSLTAEEKAAFAALPKEAQKYVADLEARRATQVQTATTKAAEAQRVAEATAARADAEAKAVYAKQVKVFAEAFAPQPPDPMLASTNPAKYIALDAEYKALSAQHEQLVQHAESLGTEAQETMTQAEIAERDRELMAIPEVANEATREEWFGKAIGEGKRLGLDMANFGHATAAELKALREIATLREKAEKYDAATARQMQRVRDGKKRTTRSNAAQPSSGEKTGYREARQRLSKSGDVNDAALAIGRLR